MKHGTRTCYSYHRCRCEPCRQANRAADKHHSENQHIQQPGTLYWPIQPLFQAAGTTEFVELAYLTGIPARTLHRSFERGLTDNTADRAAIGLGLHPIIIWPHWIDPYLEGAA